MMAATCAQAASSDYHYEADSRPDIRMVGATQVRMLCTNDTCNPVNLEMTHAHQAWTLENWTCVTTPCNLEEVVAWHPASKLISFQTQQGGYHLVQVVAHGLIDMGDGYTTILDTQHRVIKPAASAGLPWDIHLAIKPDGRILPDQKATCQALAPVFYDTKNDLEAFLVEPQVSSQKTVVYRDRHGHKKIRKIIRASTARLDGNKLQSLLTMTRYCGFKIDEAFHRLVDRNDPAAWGKAADGASEIGFWNTQTGSREVPE